MKSCSSCLTWNTCSNIIGGICTKKISIRQRTFDNQKGHYCYHGNVLSFLFSFYFRLREALIHRNERQISHICKLLINHFDFDPTNDIKRDIEESNKETLLKSDLTVICMYGLDLSRKKNLEKLLALLSRCPKVKKIELMFCTLNHEIVLNFFEATMKLETLYFLVSNLSLTRSGKIIPL